MDIDSFINGLNGQKNKTPSTRLINGKTCRFYRAGYIWISSDGMVAGMSDKKDHIKPLKINADSNGKYVIHDWYGKVDIDKAVITCYCSPYPQDGKRYIIHHKDGNLLNCDRSNLEWAPYHYQHATSDTVEMVLNDIKYKVCRDGTVKKGRQTEMFHDNLFDHDMGLECCIETYLRVPREGSWRGDYVHVDDIMKDAGFVQGDDADLMKPVILHRDGNWKNFSSENLEWVEATDPRFVSYLEQKKKDMNQRCLELNQGRYVPDFWLKH